MKGHQGAISITFRKKESGKTYLAKQFFQLPLQIMTPHYYDKDGTAFVLLLNPSGGILQHDLLNTDICCERGSSAVVTTPSNNKFYKMDDGHAEINNRITVKAGASLEYLPEHNVPFAGSTSYQKNEFRLESGARLFAVDIATAGRISRAEIFEYNLYASRTDFYVDDELVLRDNCFIEPKHDRVSDLGILDGHYVNGCLYAYSPAGVGEMTEHVNAYAGEQADKIAGASEKVSFAASKITDELAVIKVLGDNVKDVRDAVKVIWGIYRQDVLNKDPIRIRKY